MISSILLVTFVLIFQVALPVLVLAFLLSEFFSIISGAPYVPLSRRSVPKILAFGGISSSDSLYDLGCGDGRVLISGLRDFNVSKAVGYEIAPWPYLKTLFYVKRNKLKNTELFRKNCLKADIGQATFIYLYLFPKLIDKLAYKINSESNPEAKILCVGFPIETRRHPEFNLLKSDKIGGNKVYLYKLKSPEYPGTAS